MKNITPVIATIAALLLSGCAAKKETTVKQARPNPQPGMMASPAMRVDELHRLVSEFANRAAALPGRTEHDQRERMQEIFANLSQILPLLQGPNPSGGFALQLRTVESARTQLANAPKGLSIEPIIDSGLRATYNALTSTGREAFFNRDDVAESLDRLDARIRELDAVRGPFHRTTTADATRLIASILRQMADIYSQRLAAPQTVQSPTAPADAGRVDQ